MPFGMYQDEQDDSQGLISPMVRDYLMRKRQQQAGPQPVDVGEDLRKQTPPPETLTTAQENMAPLAAPKQTYDEAADSSGVHQAEQADMIAQGAGGIGKVLAQALNAKYAGHLKQPVDYSSFDSISQMGKSNLANARGARQSSIEGFKERDSLDRHAAEVARQERDFNISQEDRTRKNSWQDESQQNQRTEWGNASEDRTRQKGIQSEEDDPTSSISREYQRMASRWTGGKTDYSMQSATALKASSVPLMRTYEFDQNQQARKDTMNERRQMHDETLQNRLDAAEMARRQHEVTMADKKAGKEPSKEQFEAGGFSKRMEQAETIFDDLKAKGYNRADVSAGMGAKLPSSMRSSQSQQQEQGERNFVNAVLRRESGAAISDGEFANAELQYFPRSGDSPEVIAQKKANRQQSTASIKAASGTAYDKIPDASKSPQSPPSVDHGDEVEQDGKVFKKDPTSGKYVRIK